MFVVKVKRSPDNRGEPLPLPKYATSGSAGMDLRADKEVVFGPGERALVPSGVCLEIPEGYEGQVRPRSGLAAKVGISAVVGTIDSDYRGEVSVLLFSMNQAGLTRISRGERIGQIVFAKIEQATLEEVQELSSTDRGTKGFGSTGTK